VVYTFRCRCSNFQTPAKPAFNWLEKPAKLASGWLEKKSRAVSTCRIHVTNIKIFKILLSTN